MDTTRRSLRQVLVVALFCLTAAAPAFAHDGFHNGGRFDGGRFAGARFGGRHDGGWMHRSDRFRGPGGFRHDGSYGGGFRSARYRGLRHSFDGRGAGGRPYFR